MYPHARHALSLDNYTRACFSFIYIYTCLSLHTQLRIAQPRNSRLPAPNRLFTFDVIDAAARRWRILFFSLLFFRCQPTLPTFRGKSIVRYVCVCVYILAVTAAVATELRQSDK